MGQPTTIIGLERLIAIGKVVGKNWVRTIIRARMPLTILTLGRIYCTVTLGPVIPGPV